MVLIVMWLPCDPALHLSDSGGLAEWPGKAVSHSASPFSKPKLLKSQSLRIDR
jgi:hypothetical protein